MAMEQDIRLAIENVTRMAAATPGGLDAMKAAIANIKESQGAPDVQDACDGIEGPSQACMDALAGAVHGDTVYPLGETFPPEGQRLSEIQGADPGSAAAAVTGEEMKTTSADLETDPEPEKAVTPNETVELEKVADPGLPEEEGPDLVAVFGEVSGDSAHDLLKPREEEHQAREEAPAEVEAPRQGLAVACDAAGDVLEQALSEIRIMKDQLRFIKGLDPEQTERMIQEIEATRGGVLALEAVVTEFRNEARSDREALATLQAAMPDQAALNELHGLVVEQNRSLETGLAQLVNEAQGATQEALSKGNSDLGNFLGAELAKLREPLNASQEALGQVSGFMAAIDSMKSKLVQTWGISLFWLTAVVIYIVLRGVMSFWG